MDYEVADFAKDVLERSHEVPVLVDFWAPWCGPCKMLAPVLERLAQDAGGRWVLVKVNTEDHPDLARTFQIQSIPNVKLFRNGEVLDEFMGALPEREILRWLDHALPSPCADTVAQARIDLQQGNRESAMETLAAVLAAEPGCEEARLLLAEAWLSREPSRTVEILESIDPHAEGADQAAALRTLAQLAQMPDHPDNLPAGRGRDLYLQGAQQIKAGAYDQALEALIEVIRQDRSYADEAAKAACKAIFQFLGIRHPISERYHRAFSSALYS